MASRIEDRPYWNEMVSLKDELSLRQLADRYGTSTGAVSNAFKRNGIERKKAKSGRRSKADAARVAETLAGLEELPPEAGTRRLVRPERRNTAAPKPAPKRKTGGKRGPPPKDHLIEPFSDKLGKVPDSEIATLAGVNARTVAKYRTAADIPAYKRPSGGKKRRKIKRKRASKIDPFVDRLGMIPDREVAELAGTTPEAVRIYRVRRGIPSLRANKKSGGTAAAVAQAVARQAAPKSARKARVASGSLSAWRVQFTSGESAVVVAADLVGAATVLARHGGDVSGLEALGRALS